MMPSRDFRSRVLTAMEREPHVTRGAVRPRNVALVASGVVVPLGVFLASGGIRTGARPDALLFETAVGAGGIALVALVIALGRGRSSLGRPSMVLLGLVLSVPVAMFAWKCGISSRFPGMMGPSPDRPGFRCLQLSCLLAAWPLVAAILLRRRTDPVHPRSTGAAIGAAVGACSWVFVDLWCSVAYVPHLLLGHVLPVVACAIAGAGLGNVIALRAD